MSRWTYEENHEGEKLELTCKGPTVSMCVYADVVPEPDAVASFSLTPAKALEMAENLTMYAKEADGWTKDGTYAPAPRESALQDLAKKVSKAGIFVFIEDGSMVVVRCRENRAAHVRVIPLVAGGDVLPLIAEELAIMRGESP